ncbi:hypothetical protein CRE_27825 [Caenorhabditis remanei]|uniref:Uncharacterized protein n=1 Tax=Caenorhabditis remanei TaxID=31234 RepID=E3N5J6_CAERE|nr:hypothetical protein CRE_27825 [Caenorhabditis remanei]
MEETPEYLWCGKIILFGQKKWNKNDILGEGEFCGVPEGVKEMNFDFSGKGYLSRDYKINYQLTHNCTIDNLTRCIRPDYFTQFDPRIMSKMEFKFNAWNYGEARACIHPYNLKKFNDWNDICEKIFE